MKKVFLLFIMISFVFSAYAVDDIRVSSIAVVEGDNLPSNGTATVQVTYANVSMHDVTFEPIAYDNSNHLTLFYISVPVGLDINDLSVTATSESGKDYYQAHSIVGRTIEIKLKEDAVIDQTDILKISYVSGILDDKDYSNIFFDAGLDHVVEDDVRDNDLMASESPFSTFVSTAPLPVTYTNFTAAAEGNNAVLNWATSSEINNSHFEVERSFDGLSFTTIGKVSGNGTSNELNEYAFTDFNVNSSVAFYKLKQVDLDGKFEYSSVKEVSFSSENIVAIYPNPFESRISIDTKNYQGLINLNILDTNGKIVKQLETNDRQFDLSNLPKGAYLFSIMDENDNLIYNDKVFKIK